MNLIGQISESVLDHLQNHCPVKSAKAAAQKRARDIAMKFPQYRSYITYKAPSWRLRIGDFKTQQEAKAALNRIKSVYPNFAREMVIVRDRINIWSND